jgi:hypothetical protein
MNHLHFFRKKMQQLVAVTPFLNYGCNFQDNAGFLFLKWVGGSTIYSSNALLLSQMDDDAQYNYNPKLEAGL